MDDPGDGSIIVESDKTETVVIPLPDNIDALFAYAIKTMDKNGTSGSCPMLGLKGVIVDAKTSVFYSDGRICSLGFDIAKLIIRFLYTWRKLC